MSRASVVRRLSHGLAHHHELVVAGPTRGRATFIALSNHPLIDASKSKEILVTQAFPLPISAVVAAVRYESHGGKAVLYPT